MMPLKSGEIKIKKCQLLEKRILIGIDCGGSLTNFIFLHKKNQHQLIDEKINEIILQYTTFNSEHFESALIWLKQVSFVPEKSNLNIHITGANYLKKKAKIEAVFRLSVVHVKDDLAAVVGYKIAMEKLPPENLFYPPVTFDKIGQFQGEILKKLSEKFKKDFELNNEKIENSSTIYPFLLGIFGSGMTCFYYSKIGLAEQIKVLQNGSKTFLGLAKCLIDTNNYDEIMNYASKGNNRNVDTLAKEMFVSDERSPFPPDLPIFSFGKCVENDIGLESCSKDDISLSLVGLQSSLISSFWNQICFMKKVKKVFLAGNLFQSNLFQREIVKKNSLFPTGIEYKFLDIGFASALGAMLCSNEERKFYIQ